MNATLTTPLRRRQFLAAGTRSLAAFACGTSTSLVAAAAAEAKPLFDVAALGELQPPDANGLRLLPGFTSRVVAHSSRPVVEGSSYLWHPAPDGGACFAAPDGGWVYVSNSEQRLAAGGGGVGAVRFAADGRIVQAYSILSGTDNNCAGGRTPWQTWLSCEEVAFGLVYECDPFGEKAAQVRPALGRFKHEAVAVDAADGLLYLTEDEYDGVLYRFVPANGLPDLGAGTLQVAQLEYREEGMMVVWHDVPDPGARETPTRYQVPVATRFNGGEGIAWHEGLVYFTTKGDNRVWCYDTASAEMVILYDAGQSATPHLSGVDNVTITAAGDVLVAEDGGDMQIVLLTPDGKVLPVVQVTGQDLSEICGPAFDPSHQRLYFSSQTGPSNLDSDGITYEITRVA